MPKPRAVLVEDQPDQFAFSKEVLEDAGFAVDGFEAVGPAIQYLEGTSDLIDLFVLDRRLPVLPGQPDTDEVGDELLSEVRASHPDARVIVFTGHADVPHLQRTLSGGGQLPELHGNAIDRVTVLTKDQSIEFKEQVEQYRALIQTLDDIEVISTDPTDPIDSADLRTIRRVGLEYRAASIDATTLKGGLTGAKLWKLELRRLDGHVGTVVAKRVHLKEPLGGLQELLPLGKTASKVASISGLIGSGHINILLYVGQDPYPLMDVVMSNPAEAVALAEQLWAELESVADQPVIVTLEKVCEPLIKWDTLAEVLSTHSIAVPAPTLTMSIHNGMRHCDLHPLNILIDDGVAVLIDFDACSFGARVIDPITVLLSTLVHPSSPIRGSLWPDPAQIAADYGTDAFGVGHAQAEWFISVSEWVRNRKTSDREFWAVSLAYAARQLRYPNITSDGPTLDRVLAIATRASAALSQS